MFSNKIANEKAGTTTTRTVAHPPACSPGDSQEEHTRPTLVPVLAPADGGRPALGDGPRPVQVSFGPPAASGPAPTEPARKSRIPLLACLSDDSTDATCGPGVSPARHPRTTGEGAIIGAAAVSLALAIYLMVSPGQETPRAAAGSDLGPGVGTLIANPAPAPTDNEAASAGATAPATRPAATDTQAARPDAPGNRAQIITPPGFPAVHGESATSPAEITAPTQRRSTIEANTEMGNSAAHPDDGPIAARPATETKLSAQPPTPKASPTTRPVGPTVTSNAETTMRPAAGSFHLGTIMMGPRGGIASINGRAFTVGDSVTGAKVVRIEPLHVELELNGKRLKLRLGAPSGPSPSR